MLLSNYWAVRGKQVPISHAYEETAQNENKTPGFFFLSFFCEDSEWTAELQFIVGARGWGSLALSPSVGNLPPSMLLCSDD